MTPQKQIEKNEIDKYFEGDMYRYFIFLRTYSRFVDELGRRETWVEVVDRYVSFMRENLVDKLSEEEYLEIKNAILNQEVMPSMRLLWTSGEAARKNNAAAFNCTFTAVDNLKRFSEILFLLTSGAGVGFSVEQSVVNKLPIIKSQTKEKVKTFIIKDSREGWADALDKGINMWFNGEDIEFDYSKIRPLGARLKTFGGRASGPEPLRQLLVFVREIILNAQMRQLRPIEVHDICTKIAEIVVAGGSRRSSEISLSDLHDNEMRGAKSGNFYVLNPHRVMANNSAIYNVKPTQEEFLDEWISLMKSKSGERSIYNRQGVIENIPERRKELKYDGIWGGNPCLEIILRSNQMCNLTEVIAREDDDLSSLMDKIRIASIIGTYQSKLTDFPYLSPEWKKNCDEERLLGVSITGQMDCKTLRNKNVLDGLKKHAIKTNKKYAQKFGISQSTSITCTKPSGTVSQLVNSSSGAHPRYAKYYIRRIRIASSDPLFKMMKDIGVPYHPENGQEESTANTFVLEFPVKSPKGAITRHDMTAIEQLDYWKLVKTNYAEHTVSTTVYVGEFEWVKVANWLWENWGNISGLSFLPKEDNDHIYNLAPYEEINKIQYDKLSKEFPIIDFSLLSEYEKDDMTTGAKDAACASGSCEII